MEASFHAGDLNARRNVTLARSVYRQLREQGVAPQEIISLSTALLDLVVADLDDAVES